MARDSAREFAATFHATFHATTVVCVRKSGVVAMAADGQVSLGNVVVKRSARKVRMLRGDDAMIGFAGQGADALALAERLEELRERHAGLARACVELAKTWRTDQALRRLEAMMLVADARETFLLSGAGDLIEPDEPVIAIGSGGGYAQAAALALWDSELDARAVAERAIAIAARLCVYTGGEASALTLPPSSPSASPPAAPTT